MAEKRHARLSRNLRPSRQKNETAPGPLRLHQKTEESDAPQLRQQESSRPEERQKETPPRGVQLEGRAPLGWPAILDHEVTSPVRSA